MLCSQEPRIQGHVLWSIIETTLLFLFPFTGAMGLNYGLHKALFQGISRSWKKQSNRNHKVRLCYLLYSSHVREKDFF